MDWVESTASTVEEAKDRVLDDLGIDEQDAELEVLEEPRPGLFGRTRGKARVRARVMPKTPTPKQERRGAGRAGKARSDVQKAAASTTSEPPVMPHVDEASPAQIAVEDPPPAATATATPRQSSRPVSGGAGGGVVDAGRPDEGPFRFQDGEGVDSEILSMDEHVACVESFVRGLVGAFGVSAAVESVAVDDDTREVRVVGDDLGLLIGPRGLTIQAVHELARTVVYRRAPDGQEGRVRIDIGGYRHRRRQALEQFALKVADEVRSSGRAKALEPMAPPDRKVVHDTINGVDGVKTTSEGDEPRRHVVVHADS